MSQQRFPRPLEVDTSHSIKGCVLSSLLDNVCMGSKEPTGSIASSSEEGLPSATNGFLAFTRYCHSQYCMVYIAIKGVEGNAMLRSCV